MTADTFAHGLGVASLAVIAGAGGCSVFVLAETVVPNLSKIRAALRGHQAPAAPRCRGRRRANPQGAPMTVLQPWVSEITLMQQTVLLTAIRGPDGIPKYGPAKMLLRWYRRCILLSAMDQQVLETPYESGGGSFTGPSFNALYGSDWTAPMDELVGRYLCEIDGIPHHFQLHFLHAAQIVGYKHPLPDIREWWRATYDRLVHDMHLWPESEEQMDRRLGDNRDQWLERNDVATID